EDNMHHLIDKDQDVIDGLEKHIMEKCPNGPKNLAQELTDALHALCPPLRRLWRWAAFHAREGVPSAPGMTPRARSCDRHRDRTKVNISACWCEDSHHARHVTSLYTLRNRVVQVARIERVAARDALDRHPAAAQQPVALDGLVAILRARRRKAA